MATSKVAAIAFPAQPSIPSILCQRNRRAARQQWGLKARHPLLISLNEISEEFALSVSAGDVILLQNRWYVTHAGLLHVARRNRCAGMYVRLVPELFDAAARRFAFEATVFKSKSCKGFVGYGDADPSNVSPLVHGAEMRVAETRAVNRALRKAYGIGICSVEEIGSLPAPIEKLPPQTAHGNGGGSGNGTGPKVRDRLCQIIRQHKLDPELVKAYAVEFCGTKTLRAATREQVENFVQSLAYWAKNDRNALLCRLNSYARSKQEVVA
jgi:hypothetical protein